MKIYGNLENIDWPNFLNYLATYTDFFPAKEEIRNSSNKLKTANYEALIEFRKRGLSVNLSCSKEAFQAFSQLPNLSFAKDYFEVATLIKQISTKLQENSKLLELPIESSLSFEDINKSLHTAKFTLSKLTPTGSIKEDATPTLKKLYSRLRKLTNELNHKKRGILDKFRKFLADNNIFFKHGQPTILIKGNFAHEIDGAIMAKTQSGNLFIAPKELIEVNGALTETEELIREEESKILAEIASLFRINLNAIKHLISFATTLAILEAKAKFMEEHKASIPQESSILKLEKLRHPLVKNCVPNDVEIKSCLIITGPNMGGKTVLLKSIAIAVLSKEYNIPILAYTAKIPNYQALGVDVGDYQITGEISTFGAHAKNLAQFCHLKDSLILVDEIGASTEPEEGSALAKAVIEHLIENKNHVAVTTHFPTLKVWAFEDDRVTVASLVIDDVKLKPLYRLVYGTPSQSWGIKMAHQMGVPVKVIKKANSYLSSEFSRVANLASALVKMKQAYENYLETQKRILKELEEEKKKLESYKLKLEQEKQQEIKKIYEASLDRISELERKIKRLNSSEIHTKDSHVSNKKSTIRKSKSDESKTLHSDAPHKLKAQLVEEKTRFKKEVASIVDSSLKKLKVGDTVEFEGSTYVVRQINSDKGTCLISDEFLSIEVPVDKVKLTTKSQELGSHIDKHFSDHTPDRHPTISTKPEVHLRGLTKEEAREKLLDFLSNAYAAGWNEVRVVHGKGAGILRKMVEDELKKLPYVESFRAGRWGEGDSGVTIVKFK